MILTDMIFVHLQIPLLEAALSIHASRVTEPIAGLHDHMVSSFSKMKAEVQQKYGEAVSEWENYFSSKFNFVCCW